MAGMPPKEHIIKDLDVNPHATARLHEHHAMQMAEGAIAVHDEPAQAVTRDTLQQVVHPRVLPPRMQRHASIHQDGIAVGFQKPVEIVGLYEVQTEKLAVHNRRVGAAQYRGASW